MATTGEYPPAADPAPPSAAPLSIPKSSGCTRPLFPPRFPRWLMSPSLGTMSSLGHFLLASMRPHAFLRVHLQVFAESLGLRLGLPAASSAGLKCWDGLISRVPIWPLPSDFCVPPLPPPPPYPPPPPSRGYGAQAPPGWSQAIWPQGPPRLGSASCFTHAVGHESAPEGLPG